MNADSIEGRTAPDVSRLFVSENDSLRTAMERISAARSHGLPSGLAIMVDAAAVLRGVVTDGDIRRALLAGASLDELVGRVATRNPIVFDAEMSYREIIEQLPRMVVSTGRYRGGIVERIILTDRAGRVERVLDFFELWRNQNMRHRSIQIIGLGYVGLTLALAMADAGYRVLGVERNQQVRDGLNAGAPHIFETGLEPMLRHHLGTNLTISGEHLAGVDVHVLAVATPLGPGGRADLSQLLLAAEELGTRLAFGHLVIVRSTIPVGTTRGQLLPILERASGLRCGRDFHLAFAPERTLAGRALAELRTLPQVIAGVDQNSRDLAAGIFREMTSSIVAVETLEEAEMVKLVNNSYRDLTFAFANELSIVCEHYGLDVRRVIAAANNGYARGNVPMPSPGVGGSCLRKDPHIFAEVAQAAGIPTSLTRLGREVNESMPSRIVAKVGRALEAAGKRPATSRFFLIGLAFKGDPETSDLRDSTSLAILDLLRPLAGEIRGFDAIVPAAELRRLGVVPCDIDEGFSGADCVMLLNNHRRHATIDLYRGLAAMNRPGVYFDGWGMLLPEEHGGATIDGVLCLGLSSMVPATV